ncbi:MAG TPA: hypothetical protein EYH25_00150 [Thermotoga sp.]|nr:hypothetical protein [Thermotoga sp.]
MVDAITAIAFGTFFLITLSKSYSISYLFFFGIMSFLSYKIVSIPKFRRSLLILKIIIYYPKAFIESISLILKSRRKRIIESVDIHDEWEELVETLIITMTPKSLVIDSEEDYMTVHKVV